MLGNMVSISNQCILENKEIIIILLFTAFVISLFLSKIDKLKKIFLVISVFLSLYILLFIMLMANHFSCYLLVLIIVLYCLATDDVKCDVLKFLEAYSGKNGAIQNISKQEELFKILLKEIEDLKSCVYYIKLEKREMTNDSSHSKKSDVEWKKYLRSGLLNNNLTDIYTNTTKNIIYEKGKKISCNNKVIYPDGIKRRGNTDYILEIKYVNFSNNSMLYSQLIAILKNYIIFYKDNLPNKKVDIFIKLIMQDLIKIDKDGLDIMIKNFQEDIKKDFNNKYTIHYEVQE